MEIKRAPLGWCLDGNHDRCPGEVSSGTGRIVCTCRRGSHHHQHEEGR